MITVARNGQTVVELEEDVFSRGNCEEINVIIFNTSG